MPYRLFIGGLTAAILTTVPHSASAAEARYFGGYRCTDQCKRHAAGFLSAREHRITNPDHCADPIQSRVQGCRVYSRDRMRDGTKDDGGKPIE